MTAVPAQYPMPTTGRLPVIAFSDNASNDTFMSVLDAYKYWCVALVLKDGSYPVEVMIDHDVPSDMIGGKTFNHDTNRWNGPEFVVDLDDVAQVVVL